MKRLVCAVVCLLWLGCAAKEEPLPPLPPMSEDLSTWMVPELVQPPKQPLSPIMAKDRPPTKEEQVVEYKPGVSTKVQVPTDGPLDILLQPGEEVRQIVGGEGDAAPKDGEPASNTAPQIRWEQKVGKHGAGETVQDHIFLHAKVPNLTMGIIVTTSRRVYYLTCKSVRTSQVRVVYWKYAEENAAPVDVAKEPGLLPDPTDPRRYHVGYTLTASQKQMPDWFPRAVIDDGKKMYVVYPEISLYQTVPVVRMIGPNGPQLVNARQFLNVVIVDQLAPRLELRVGIGETAEVVTIARGNLRTIECPGADECPVWPGAAQTLARRMRP